MEKLILPLRVWQVLVMILYLKWHQNFLSGTTASFSNTTVKAGQPVSLIINSVNVKGNQSGQILVRAFAPGLDTMERLINIEIVGANLSSLQTLLPENGSSGVVALPKFNWIKKVDAETYEIQLSNSSGFCRK